MPDREPATRHLRADELRDQLELLSEERKTTLFRRRSAQDAAQSISGPSERTVTMLDAGIQALAGEPTLGIGTACELEQPPAAPRTPSRGPALRVSDTYRLPRLGKKAPLVGGALVLLTLANLGAAIAWQSSTRARADRVVQQPTPAHSVEAPPAATSPAAAAPASTRAQAVLPAEPRTRAPEGARFASTRAAVELLLAGRTREALDAYRALVAEPGSSAALSVLVELLEHELAACGEHPESERCAN